MRIGLVLALLWLPLAAVAQEVSVRAALEAGRPVVIAHRTAVLDAPENTLAWIDAAIATGAAMVHLNPQITADGRYILMHDNTLNRMTNVESVFADGVPGGPTRAQRGGLDYVRDYTLAQIKQLSIPGADGRSHPVPTLEEALAHARGRIAVLLGLKSYETASLAPLVEGQADEVLAFELHYPGTVQEQLRPLAEASGALVALGFYQRGDYAAEMDVLAERTGPALRAVTIASGWVTPALLERLAALDVQLVISGLGRKEDSAIVTDGDAGPWQEALDQGAWALTAHPAAVQALLER